MDAQRVLYYATDRKGSRNEPHGDASAPSTSVGRQEYFGPFRNDELTFGRYKLDSLGQLSLERLPELESLPIDEETDVVVFVHGFNSEFATYLKVLGGIAQSIETSSDYDSRKTVFLLYSWPSMGSPFAYMQDECSAQYSYPKFESLIDSIRNYTKCSSKIHLVAHSLGAQIVHRYLLRRDTGDTSFEKRAGTVILSCPDLDYLTATLNTEREKLSKSVDQAYVMVSDVDRPLELSRALHGYTRLGRPALPSAASLFWGTFRTGSIPNIVSTAVHTPDIIARRALKRVRSGFRNPDDVWKEENKHRAITFAENVHLYDFTVADQTQRYVGHSICFDLIASFFNTGKPPTDWEEETIVKIPDEFVECSLVPYARSTPYKREEQNIFLYRKITPPWAKLKKSRTRKEQS